MGRNDAVARRGRAHDQTHAAAGVHADTGADGRGDDGLFVLVVADRHSETLCCAIRLNGTVFASPVVYASGLKPEMKFGFRIVSVRRHVPAPVPTRKNAPEVGSGALQYQVFLGRSVREAAEKGRDLQVVILGLAHLRILLLGLHRLGLV